MHIEHVALWTNQLEKMKEFYEKYFHAAAGKKYHNPATQFESYFLSFSSGARFELMAVPGIQDYPLGQSQPSLGYTHMAFAVGSEDEVTRLTKMIEDDGYTVLKTPRRTGDGYFESVILDPEGNRVEITV